MALICEGKVLEAKPGRGTTNDGHDFEYLEVAVLTGKADIVRGRLARDFHGDTPREGAEVRLETSVSAFSGRAGARVSHTFLANLAPAAKAA